MEQAARPGEFWFYFCQVKCKLSVPVNELLLLYKAPLSLYWRSAGYPTSLCCRSAAAGWAASRYSSLTPGPCWQLLVLTETLSPSLVGDASYCAKSLCVTPRREASIELPLGLIFYLKLILFSAVAVPVYEIPSGRVLAAFSGHLKIVYDLCWSRDDQRLLSASSDGTVRWASQWWNCLRSVLVCSLLLFVCLILPLAPRHQRVERGEAPGNGPEGPPPPVLRVLRSLPPGGTEPGGDGRLRCSAAGLESRRRWRERPVAARVWRPRRLRQHSVFWPRRFGGCLTNWIMK